MNTGNIMVDLEYGLKLKKKGHFKEAKEVFRKLIAGNRDIHNAQHHLGNTLVADNQLNEGICELQKVCTACPRDGLVHFNLGCALFQSQRFQEALAAFSRSVVLLPELVDARINRGSAYHALGRLQEALAEFNKALVQSPDEIDTHWNRALTLLTMGHYQEGFKEYEWRWQRHLNTRTYPFEFKQPRWQGSPFPNQRLLVYSEQGLGDTLQFVRFLPLAKNLGGWLIFEVRPELASLLKNLKGPDEFTIFSPEKPCRIDFDLQIPLMSLPGALNMDIYKLPKPLPITTDHNKRAFWQQKLDVDKINIGLVWAGQPSHINDRHRSLPLNAFSDLIQLENANFYSLQTGPAAQQAKVFNQFENFFDTTSQLNTFTDTAALIDNLDLVISVDTAVAHLAASLNRPTWVLLSFVPDWRWQRKRKDSPWYPSVTLFRQSQPGEWNVILNEIKTLIKDKQAKIRHINALTANNKGNAHEKKQLSLDFAVTQEKSPATFRSRILNIAYLSGDFRDHPVAHNMVNLFRLHDRRQFNIFAYSFGPDDGSYYRKQIEKDCDSFVDISNFSDKACADHIKNDKIDILIELMGHTRDNRLRICTFRPAPIQVSYLGYPGTTGADFIDYLIADEIVIPITQKKYYSEQITYLPDGFMIADRAPIGPRPKRKDCNLPEKGFIFCSFNNAYKIEPVMFDIWMEILRMVPGSALWLRRNNQRMVSNLRNEAEKRSVAGDRLLFANKVDDKKDHLARLQLADLYLDTRIYNGHTTTLDALWAGVPVITVKGHHFASRVSSSNLHNLDLNELITPNLESYRNLSVKLAHDPQTLSLIRKQLTINKMTQPLFNTENTTINLEATYQKIWNRHTKNNTAAAPIRITP